MIERLENNEQILLMYLADELPPDDRKEVEQVLLVDGSLRRDLEQLQAAQEMLDANLARLDEVSPPPISADYAARQMSRAMRQKLARPKISYTTPAKDRAVRSWRWLYPTVAAASVAIVAMIWLGREAQPTPGPVSGISPLPHLNAVAEDDPNDTLLIQSLESKAPGDEEGRQVAEAGPQDELSQYLLSVSAKNQ